MSRDALEQLSHSMRLPSRRRSAITRELQAHLDDARRELELAGWHPEEAARESLARLGDPAEIASGFEHVYRPAKRAKFGVALVLASGMILGAYGIGGSHASARSAHHAQPAKVVHVLKGHVKVTASSCHHDG